MISQLLLFSVNCTGVGVEVGTTRYANFNHMLYIESFFMVNAMPIRMYDHMRVNKRFISELIITSVAKQKRGSPCGIQINLIGKEWWQLIYFKRVNLFINYIAIVWTPI